MHAILEIILIVVVGCVTGAELGSWSCVQPVVAKLPYAHYVETERAMLRTFGRVMPVLMPLSGVLAIVFLILFWDSTDWARWPRLAAAGCLAITMSTTLLINVPINRRTADWSSDTDSPVQWLEMRKRWHFFQGVRGALYLSAFVLLVIAAVL